MVSQGEGLLPNWSPDGNTLYYFTGNGQPVMAARLQRNPVPVVLSTDTLFTLSSFEPFPGSSIPTATDSSLRRMPRPLPLRTGVHSQSASSSSRTSSRS